MSEWTFTTGVPAAAPAAPPAIPMPTFGATMERVSNRIFFYSEIARDKVLQLNKGLQDASREIITDKHTRGLTETLGIFLHVQSYGGEVFAGLSAMDEILRCRVPVTTVVDGCAASAATFLTIAGGHRQISRNAYMLIHQLSGGAWGNYMQLRDAQQNSDALMAKIRGIYMQYTKLSAKRLDDILKHDLWFDAKTCLKYGLVDEII